MNYAINNDRQRYSIISNITALMQDLQKLAPHPEQPNNKGPLFIKSNANFKVANDHDGMLGGMVMESMLGAAFSEAVSDTFGSWSENLDLMNIMECYSEYITDIEGDNQKTAAHGQGTLARLSSKPLSGSFNIRSTISSEMQSFMDDLPKRMKIEHDLAYYAKQLDMLDAPAPQYVHQYSNFAA